jgi:hypothetical protein
MTDRRSRILPRRPPAPVMNLGLLATDTPHLANRSGTRTSARTRRAPTDDRTPDTMDESQLITKYTGHRLDPAALIAAREVTGMAAALATALGQAALKLDDVENELTRLTPLIIQSLTKVATTITAGPGQPAPGLNPVGELQAHGQRFDTLIAVREERIQQLRVLVELWLQLPAPRTGPHRT